MTSPICIYRFFVDAEQAGKKFFQNIAGDFVSDEIASASAENISVLYPNDNIYVYNSTTNEVLHLWKNGVRDW